MSLLCCTRQTSPVRSPRTHPRKLSEIQAELEPPQKRIKKTYGPRLVAPAELDSFMRCCTLKQASCELIGTPRPSPIPPRPDIIRVVEDNGASVDAIESLDSTVNQIQEMPTLSQFPEPEPISEQVLRSLTNQQHTPEMMTFHQDVMARTPSSHAMVSNSHDFLVRDLGSLVMCEFCKELIFGRAIQCAECKLLIHMRCELDVAVVRPCTAELVNGTAGGPGSGKYHRKMLQFSSAKQSGNDTTAGNIEVLYVTERILVLTFPSGGTEASYRKHLKDVSHMLKSKHGNNYKVFNLSKKRHDLLHLNAQVLEFGWPGDLAPPLERLCAICKEMEAWLANGTNVLVLHSKGGRARAGLVVAAYMHYTNICAAEDQALDRFAMRRFYDEHMSGISQPSMRRYVSYFSGLLSGDIRIHGGPLYLRSIVVEGLPDGKNWQTFLKLYERLDPVYTSPVLNPTESRFSLRLDGAVQLRGDVLLKCYQYRREGANGRRELLFRVQFNTCALTSSLDSAGSLVLQKRDLDEACYDNRFPEQCRLQLVFSFNAGSDKNSVATSAVDHAASSDQLLRTDSYADFDKTEDEPLPSDDQTYKNGSAGLYASQNGGLKTAAFPLALNSTVCRPNDSTDSGISTGSGIVTTPLTPPRPCDRDTSPEPGLPELQVQVTSSEQGKRAEIRSVHDFSPGSKPQNYPSNQPQNYPSNQPQNYPSNQPQNYPSTQPQNYPSNQPQNYPSNQPQNYPSNQPQNYPSNQPQNYPSTQRSYSPRSQSRSQNPPATPPKPRSGPATPPPSPPQRHQPIEFAHRPPPISPPSKRPQSPHIRTSSPQSAHIPDATLIDVHLIGHDRFDPASKAFSYVPVQSLQDHFRSPKKATKLVPEYKPAAPLARSSTPGSSIESQSLSFAPSSEPAPTRPLSTTNEFPRTIADLDKDLFGGLDFGNEPIIQSSKTTPRGFGNDSTAQSFRTEPLSRQHSDIHTDQEIDKLLDPNFYLSFTTGSQFTSTTQTAPRPASAQPIRSSLSIAETSSYTRPGTSFGYDSSMSTPVTPLVPPRQVPNVYNRARPPHRTQHYKSDWELWGPTGPPPPVSGRYSATRALETPPTQRVTTPSYSECDPDEWLDYQLQKLKIYRELKDPILQRRKVQERILLDELKHVHDERQVQRGRNEADYTVEGFGSREGGPDGLIEHDKLSSRIKTARISGKPPTPPPRDRSNTPPSPRRSPLLHGREPVAMTSAPPDKHRILDFAINSAAESPQHAPPMYAAITRQSPKPILKKPKQDGYQQQHRGSPMSSVSLIDTHQGASSPFAGSRSETPAFPIGSRSQAETPLPFHPLLYAGATADPHHHHNNMAMAAPKYGHDTAGSIYALSHGSSLGSLDPTDIIHHHPVFVKDTSKYWYKPRMSREETIQILRSRPPGTFIIRDSNSFPNAFGLALKVATPPPGIEVKPGDDTELVRHFLIEPSSNGVKLKGCSNEPVFGSLSALVYQHSITPLALPCRLLLPEYDPVTGSTSATDKPNSANALLEQGAACNVTYLFTSDTESLTGPEAVRRTIQQALSERSVTAISAHFKVSNQGITVTDNTRQLFFRRHYPSNSVTFCGLDPEDRRWSYRASDGSKQSAKLFGFVARKIASRTDNACHVFAEAEPEQPATAIVNFVTKVMMPLHRRN